jgi:flagellin
MPQVINTNIMSLTAQRNLNKSASGLQTSMQRLSSGLRINSAKDDAAGLAISERFTTQIRGLNQAIRNANDGVSFAQTAEGALGTVGDSLQRIRELAVQSINDTNSSSDREALNNEVTQLIAEVNRIASSTQFNGQNVLDGTLSDLTFQVGANQNQTISVTGVDARGSQLGAEYVEGGDIAVSEIAALTDDVTVNGISISLGSATTQADVISAINAKSASSGVTAIKDVETTSDAVAYTAAAGGSITLNGVSISLDNVASGDVAAAINAFSTQTGVTVTGTTSLTFSNETGDDIVIADGSTGVLDAAGDETYSSGIKLVTDIGESITLAGTDIADLGFTAGAQTLTTSNLNDTNVLTGDDANDALLTIDFALQQVTGLRAELGSVQVRFESTINNLEITSENMSAARSRIRDADFAAETANLTRVQILQQAGISMLAQANAAPQNVLALLQ